MCSRWLATSDSQVVNDSGDQRYDRWAATSIGELLETLPHLRRDSLPAALRANLQRCLNQTEHVTKEALAGLAGAGPCTFHNWTSGLFRPTLDHLCRLAYRLKLPLTQLFLDVPAEWRGPNHLGRNTDSLRARLQSRPRIERGGLRRILAGVLIETPAPSVAEVARRLKFRRTQSLASREPEFCRQIALRRRTSGVRSTAAGRLYPRSARRHLEAVMRAYLDEDSPPSINEIACRLEYKSSGGIRERFPELCRAIVAKRKQQVLRKKEAIRRALEGARVETPPPTLKQIGRRFGYTAEGAVVRAFPDLCQAYKEWRREQAEERRRRLGIFDP